METLAVVMLIVALAVVVGGLLTCITIALLKASKEPAMDQQPRTVRDD